MKITTCFCDRCHKECKESELGTVDFNIKEGMAQYLIPRIEDCCVDCRQEIIDIITTTMQPKEKPKEK